MRHPRSHPQGESAVSDVVGSVLLVGITVVLATVLGSLLFAFKGPQPVPQVNLAVTVAPGNAAWGNGDEQIRVVHNGGEALVATQTIISYSINGVQQAPITGTALGSSLYQGTTLLAPRTSWVIGQTFVKTLTLAATDTVSINVVTGVGAGATSLAASSVLVPGEVAAGASCPFDTSPPSVSAWVQTPNDVTKNTVGAVTVAATVLDNCSGVDAANVPHLFWRLRGITTPAYTDAGAMTTQGLGTWTGTIPSQTWLAQSGKILEYYIGSLKDLQGNTAAQSATQQDVVDVDCTLDVSPPNVSAWVQAPVANLLSTSTPGTVTITATIADNCWGVDGTATPQLWFRLNDGTNPAYAQAGVMTLVGANQWQGVIPTQTWYQQSGKTLQYQLQNLKDLGGNTGSSAANSDLIDLTSGTVYVSTHSETTGTTTTFANEQSATDSNAVATLAEAISGGSGTSTLAASTLISTGGGWTSAGTVGTNAGNAAASDNAYATTTTSGSNVRYALADQAGTPGAITSTAGSVVLKLEQSITSTFSNDGWTLQACFNAGYNSGACSTVSGFIVGSAADTTITYDITALRPGGGSWSWTDINNLEMVVTDTVSGARDGTWRIDQAFITVGYAPGYTMSIQNGFATVPAATPTTGAVTVGLNYRTTGDTFVVQVFDGTTWNTRGAALNSVALTTWTYVLSTLEYQAGAPQIRFIDQSYTTTQGNLFIEYARTVTT